jgi:Flp pilus assembly protein TadG
VQFLGEISMMLYAGAVEGGGVCQYPRTRAGRNCVRVVTKWRDESGAELVEAALVLPLLLMLLLGIVTFGRAYNVYQTITRAAREGARELVMTGCATCADALTPPSASSVQTNYVNPALTASSLDPTKVTNYTSTYVYLDPNDPVPDICGVQISFKYPYTLSLPFTTLNLSTIKLSTTVQMRLETQPSTCNVGGAVP